MDKDLRKQCSTLKFKLRYTTQQELQVLHKVLIDSVLYEKSKKIIIIKVS